MRRFASVLILALSLPSAGWAATLVVRAEGIEPAGGEVKVAVCARNFSESGCDLGGSRMPEGAAIEFVFENIAPGRYAIAAYHDVDGNGELDTIPPGIPTEPYGFSNEVGRLGIPSFQRALVAVGEGRTVVVVRLAHFLGRS